MQLFACVCSIVSLSIWDLNIQINILQLLGWEKPKSSTAKVFLPGARRNDSQREPGDAGILFPRCVPFTKCHHAQSLSTWQRWILYIFKMSCKYTQAFPRTHSAVLAAILQGPCGLLQARTTGSGRWRRWSPDQASDVGGFRRWRMWEACHPETMIAGGYITDFQ